MVRYLNMLLDNYSILQPLFLQSKILELVKTKISLFFSYLKKKKSWHVEIMACGKLFRLGNKGTDGLPSVERAEKTATLRTSRRRQASRLRKSGTRHVEIMPLQATLLRINLHSFLAT